MKKYLLLAGALMVVGSALAFHNAKPLAKDNVMVSVGPMAPEGSSVSISNTRASGSIDFSYANSLYGALKLSDVIGGTTRVYMMFEMSPEDIKAYAGNRVTGFTVYSPVGYNNAANTITEGRFFYTTDMKSEAYTQNFTLSKTKYAANKISLDTPYTISGDEDTLAFGYSIVVPKNDNMYYFPIDYEPNDNPATSLFNVSDDGSFPTGEWGTLCKDYGALCMSIKIEGDALPENIAEIAAVDSPMYLPMSGDGVEVEFLLRNAAANPITSVEVTVTMTDTPDLVQTIEFPSLEYNKTTVLAVKGVKGTTLGFGTLGMYISKVNGEEKKGELFTAKVPVYDNGYEMKVVAEDATGTWCGWCPGGIEALEYLKTAYPDKAIGIGVHNQDAMAISSYQEYIQAYVSGFPNIMYNRCFDQTPTDNYDDVCAYIDEVIEFFSFPSYADVELTGNTSIDNETAEVSAKTTFVFNTDIPHYLSFVIVEDGVGPYKQKNYFYRNTYGLKMNGWESKGSEVSIPFNDVARYYKEFPGIENSLPSKIEANVANEYSISLPLKNVVKNDYRVIALITNGENGRIVNACQINLAKAEASVDGIEDSNYTPVEYFNLNGIKVSNPKAGIFIRKQGVKTEKVIIK